MQSSRTHLTKTLKGFTLIELLVVIAIIGLLSTIIAAPIQSARKKARDAKKIAELKGIQSAVEQYAESNSNNYPANLWTLYPSYLPSYSRFASTTDTGINNRDKFAYVTMSLVPITAGGATTTSGYHLGVHLESYNVALDTDPDCMGTSTLTTPSSGSCWKFDSSVYTTFFTNSTSGIAGGINTVAGTDFSGADTGTSTCSAVSDCVYDIANQQ